MPAARPLIVEQGDEDDEDAVDASSLEVTRTAPGSAALSPSRIPLRGASGVADSPPIAPPVEPVTSATIPAARVPLKDPPSGAGKAISRLSPSPIARESAAPAVLAARPGGLGYVVVFAVGAVAVAGAFFAGRITAPSAGSFPLPQISTPASAASPEVTAAQAETEEAAAPSPEETTAAPDP